ncbi:MAG: M56 family metallopeptidase [bacterium]|nr:M56 family metallopeptidase [bacterium]
MFNHEMLAAGYLSVSPVFLVEVLVKGGLVLSLALAVERSLRRGAPRFRHHLLTLGTVVLLALPVALALAPDWTSPVLPTLDDSWLAGMDLEPAPVSSGTVDPAVAASAETIGWEPVAPQIGDSAGPRGISALPWLVMVWSAGAAWVLLRLAVGHARIRRTVASAALDPAFAHALSAAGRRLGLGRLPRMLISGEAVIPFTWGVLRPCIVLPAAARDWSASRLELVLLHELAHIKRRDALTNAVSQLSIMLHWFNPLAWLVRSRLMDQQEQASDDLVLDTGVRASEYAICLVDFARSVRAGHRPPDFQVAMAGRSRLDGRVKAILGRADCPGSSVRPGGRRGWLGLVATVVVMVSLAGYPLFARDDASLTGDPAATSPVTPAEQKLLTETLDAFHDALYQGRDYGDVCRQFLCPDYFADPSRTFENWPAHRRDEVLGNTVSRLRRLEPGTLLDSRLLYRAEVLDCRRRDEDYVLTQRVNIGSENRSVPAAGMVRDLEQTVVFTRQDGDFRIKSYDGGINVGRMDVDNPYGPIFVVTLQGDAATHPGGPLLFKSVPRSMVPGVRNLIPLD